MNLKKKKETISRQRLTASADQMDSADVLNTGSVISSSKLLYKCLIYYALLYK